MLSKEEVKHIAKLARLGLTKKETEQYQRELSKILDYIEKLKEVDISKVKAMSHSVLVENVIREDKERSIFDTQPLTLLDLAPETKDGFLKVKKVI